MFINYVYTTIVDENVKKLHLFLKDGGITAIEFHTVNHQIMPFILEADNFGFL